MKIKAVKLIYFSPTNTTRKVLEGIAKGIQAERVERLDLTPAVAEAGASTFVDADLVIIGVPVYTGRVAQTALNRLARLKTAQKTPAILVAVYGNRAYEDALIELKDLALVAGFAPIAAGAFIGEHSFATDAAPIARGRPDEKDLEEATAFGRQIRSKMEAAKDLDTLISLQVPGNSPYRERNPLPKDSPMTQEALCALCGTCVKACPTGAIAIGDKVTTDTSGCIYCCACVKGCPTKARVMTVPMIKEIADRLSKSCVDRKTAELFI